jgi:hypothetical protein
MKSYEIRDLEQARRFLLQGLWWQRVVPPAAATVQPALQWAMEAASAGQPLPPVGFIADLGQAAFGLDEGRSGRSAAPPPALPINLVRTYEDHVLGKLYADWTFNRAGDALRRYQGRDRARGLAYLLDQFRQRANFPGVEFAPGVIKAALDAPPDEVLGQGWESLRNDGVMPLLLDLYEALIAAARRTAEVLGQEDLFELESQGALADPAERLARRQVLRAAAALEAAVPHTRVRPPARRMEVPTRILDEDTYPVGGFTSISNRGSVESLLHSQLAYMEPEGSDAERPDLFDIKFLRDELLYYARDENQFLRRRRTFVLALQPDLVATRFKDAELPYQRGVLLLALIVVVVRKLSEWLSTDALSFQIVLVGKPDPEPLAPERELLEAILREQIVLETVRFSHLPAAQVAVKCKEWARRSLCHCLTIGVEPAEVQAEDTLVSRLQIDGPRPALDEPPLRGPEVVEADDPFESWSQTLEQILQRWI